MAERIANSKATVETEYFTSSTPPENNTNATFHRRSNSELERKDEHFISLEDDKGVFKSFKECDETTENKQLPLASNPLASNAVTNDTDNLASHTQGIKKMRIENSDFEAIKEVDENNESYDARKQFEELDIVSRPPNVVLEKRVISEADNDLEFGAKHDSHEFDDDGMDEEYKNQHTQEEEEDDSNDANMLFVEQKLCAV